MLKKHLTLLLFLCATCALHAANYLTFTAEEDSSSFGIDIINLYEEDSSSAIPDVQYSLDGGKTWTKLPTDTFISLKRKGDKALLRGNNPQGFSDITSKYTKFVMTGRIAASGSVMSLIGGNDKNLTIKGEKCFYRLFIDCTSLTKAPELPATQLANSCYEEMFRGCTNLKQAPKLPAKTLAENCYKGMFQECTSLTQAPQLPAKTLADDCYMGMFSYCTSLTHAPELPATQLANSCYVNMFLECTSLTKAPKLPATQLASSCYVNMFLECTSLTKAPKLPATQLASSCYVDMFWDCTRLTKAPKLPATTLAIRCYKGMFRGCIRLAQAPQLPATTLAQSCYEDMFSGCIRLAQAPQLPATTLAYNCYYNMFKDCISLPNAPYPSDTCVASPANKKLYGHKKSGKGPMDTMYICRTNNDTIHVEFEKVSIVHKYSFGRQFKRINDNKLRIKTEGHKNNFLSCEECKITRYSVDQKVDIAFLTGIDLKTNPTDEMVHLRTTSQDGELISEITIILYPEPTLYLKINDSIVKIDSTVPMPSFNEKDDIRLIAMPEDGRDLKVIEHRWGYMDGHHVRPVCGCDLIEIIKGNQINPKHLKRMIGSGEEKIWFYFRYYDRHLNRVFQSGRPFFNTEQTSPNTD